MLVFPGYHILSHIKLIISSPGLPISLPHQASLVMVITKNNHPVPLIVDNLQRQLHSGYYLSACTDGGWETNN